MSFQKNPPWQKNVPMQGFAQQMGLQQLNHQMGFLHQNHVAFPNAQPMLQMNQLVNQVSSVQYPPARVNPMAFQQSPQQSTQNIQQQQQQQQQSNSKYNANNKMFSGTGLVTKIQNDIGFIDDEVLFHKSACVKGEPKLGDLVLLEATYNQQMPFKWNAQRVQVLQKSSGPNSGSGSGGGNNQNSYNTAPPGTSMHNNDTYRNRRYSAERRRTSPDRRARSRERREEVI